MLKFIIKEILVTEDEIEQIVTRLGKEIDRDYADKNLVIVCVLKERSQLDEFLYVERGRTAPLR